MFSHTQDGSQLTSTWPAASPSVSSINVGRTSSHPSPQHSQYPHQNPQSIPQYPREYSQYTLAHVPQNSHQHHIQQDQYYSVAHTNVPAAHSTTPSLNPAFPVEYSSGSRPTSSSSTFAASSDPTFVPDPSHHKQQQEEHPSFQSSVPPGSSGSVSSGESAISNVTTGPATIVSTPQLGSSRSAGVPASSSSDTPSHGKSTTTHASPLFDVPPGYRTMLSSDKQASQVVEQNQQQNEPSHSKNGTVSAQQPSTSSGHPVNTLESSLSSSGRHQQQAHMQAVGHQPSSSDSSPTSYMHSSSIPFNPPTFSSSQHQYSHQQLHYQQPSAQIPQQQYSVYHQHSIPLQYQQLGTHEHQYQQQHPQAIYYPQEVQTDHVPSSAFDSSAASTSISNSVSKSRGSSHHPERQVHHSQDMAQEAGLRQSRDRPSLDTQFVVPAPPSSAPASTTHFDADTGRGQPVRHGRHGGAYKIEPSDPLKFRNSFSSSSNTGMSIMPASASHSRSTSVSSATYSSFGPLSASASSSASSSFGELSSSTSTPRRSMRLSNLDRKSLCQYADANPRVKHEHIGSMFGVERSTVSKILKQKSKWLSVHDDNSLPLSPTSDKKAREVRLPRTRIGRHPELEGKLVDWGREQTREGIILTDEAVRTKALEIAEALRIDVTSFKASAGWLENFKDRCGYRGGKFSLSAVLDFQGHVRTESEEVIDEDAETTSQAEGGDPPKTAKPEAASEAAGTGSAGFSGFKYTPQPYLSPLALRKPRRSAFSSMSSSSISLPELAEQEEHRGSHLENSSSSIDLRSGESSGSNFNTPHLGYNLRPQPSFSTESSPFPSPTCSAASDGASSGASHPNGSVNHPPHISTPTQRSLYSVPYTSQTGENQPHSQGLYETDPAGSHLRQASINFNLSLNSAPSPHPQHHMQSHDTYPSPEYTSIDSPAAVQSGSYDNKGFATQQTLSPMPLAMPDDRLEGGQPLRTRMHSAPGYSGMILTQLGNEAYHARQETHPMASNLSHPATASFTDFYHSQHKVPLHRSQTDPMPLYPNMAMATSMHSMADDSNNLAETTLMPSDADIGETLSMQIDGNSSQHYGNSAGQYMQQQQELYLQHTQGSSHSYHPRRATVSSGGDTSLTFSSSAGTGSSYGHGHSYSMSAVTTPIFSQFGPVAAQEASAATGKTTLEEAYLALRKVIGFLQDPNPIHPNQSSLAAPSQLSTLEALLTQFREAYVSQIPTLTPPSST